MFKRILNYSGGKDSTAMYLLALEHGKEFTAVFADTGNEHQLTYEFVRSIHIKTGGPRVRWIRADFSEGLAKKRIHIVKEWPKHGVPKERIDRAVGLLHPTGSVFLDLCMLKGVFPSPMARFCTQYLKWEPIMTQVFRPLIDRGEDVVSWQGVRADESRRRSKLLWREHDWEGLITFRPLLRWTVEDVFAIHRRHNLEPNPLYRNGMGRVGCMPCIHAPKHEIYEISRRFPDAINKIAEWEDIVSTVSRRGSATFYPAAQTPGTRGERSHIRNVVKWSKTVRGGKQYSLLSLAHEDKYPLCSSVYGLCE